MTTLNDSGYPRELFDLPENFIQDTNLRTLHAEVCARLLADQPSADMLDVLIIERVATAYFYVRQKEEVGAEGSPTAYKNMIRMWLELATELRKKRIEALDENQMKEKLAGVVVDALNTAIYGLDPKVQRVVRDNIVGALETL